MRKSVIAVVIVAALVLVAAFVPLVQAEYRHTETYLEDEPYEVTETYYEDEPYDVTETYTAIVPLRYSATSSVVVRRWETRIPGLPPMSGVETVRTVRVTNTDGVSGTFTVSFSHSLTVELYLTPGEAGEAKWPIDGDQNGDWTYTVGPSTKEVEEERTVGTEYRQVEKERTVTKYRQVERGKLVIRYETVPLFEYLRSLF